VLKFRKKEYQKLHDFIYENIVGIIASDIDYDIPMQGDLKYLGMIPNPVNVKIEAVPLPSLEKIVIFHGINSENYYKKGNDYFEKALDVIQKKYQDKVEIITTRSVPYAKYIESYNKAHIVLDMVYSFDQGFNALEAMAKGKWYSQVPNANLNNFTASRKKSTSTPNPMWIIWLPSCLV
jgi:hypothetical protein